MKVIVTRPRREADVWVKQLRALQLDAVALPLIHIGPPKDHSGIVQAWQNLHQYSALMFVSSNAVRYFFQSIEDLSSVKYACDALKLRAWATGPGTREALLAASVPADAIDAPTTDAPQFDSEALWHRVQAQVHVGDKVLIVRGSSVGPQAAGNVENAKNTKNVEDEVMNGRPWLADQLMAAGVQVDFVVSYQRSLPVFDVAELALIALARVDGSLWLLSSSEAVTNLTSAAALDWSQARALATHPRIAQAARAAGFGVVYESRPLLADVAASIESLL